MSFLDNVLSSIGSKPERPPAPKPRTQIPDNVRPLQSASLKRKADDASHGQETKRERVEFPSSPNGPDPQRSEPPLAYRGTARALNAQPIPKPSPKSTPVASTTSSQPKSVTEPSKAGAPRPVSVTPAAAPRGFAAILARGQAASQIIKTQSFTAIKHKAAETRKERLAREREEQSTTAKATAKIAPEKNGGKTSLNGSRKSTPSDPKGIEKRGERSKREPVDLGYKGTAKPVEIGYKGTAHLSKNKGVSNSGSGYDRSRSNSAAASARRRDEPRRSRYDDYSEDERYDDYDSDASSDMEARWDDVEDEEQLALKAAIKDDARERQLEQKLKTDKEKRKAALARLAAERAKR